MGGCGCDGGCAAAGCGCKPAPNAKPSPPAQHRHSASGTPSSVPRQRGDGQKTHRSAPVTHDPSLLVPGLAALRPSRSTGLKESNSPPDPRRPERLLPGVAIPLDGRMNQTEIGRALAESHRRGNILRAGRPAHERLARFRHPRATARLGGIATQLIGANDEEFEFRPVEGGQRVGDGTVHQKLQPNSSIPITPLFPGSGNPLGYVPTAAVWSAMREVQLGYRTTRFGVDKDFGQDWWADWLQICDSDDADASYGLVSSITETIEALWQPFWGEREGDNDTMDSFLTCWNLPSDWRNYGVGHVPLFWRNDAGPARKVYDYALRLVRTYWYRIEYTPKYQKAYSDGFGQYVKILLEGGSPDAPYGGDGHSCPLRIRVANNEQDWPTLSPRCDGTPGHCWTGTAPGSYDGTVMWDQFDQYWNADFWCVSDVAGDAVCELPSAGKKANYGATTPFVAGGPEICLHPVKQAFKGMVCDTIMHNARMAYDYSRYLRSLGAPDDYVDWYRLQAERVARYALRIMVDVGELFVHELAHFWDESAHSNRDCFSQVCAEHWSCHVRAHLGLPRNVWYPQGTNEGASLSEIRDDYTSFEDDYMAQRDQNNGCDTKEGRRFVSECRIEGYGITGGKAAFCATGTIEVYEMMGMSWYATELSETGELVVGSKSQLQHWCSDAGGLFEANFD